MSLGSQQNAALKGPFRSRLGRASDPLTPSLSPADEGEGVFLLAPLPLGRVRGKGPVEDETVLGSDRHFLAGGAGGH